MFSNIRKQNKIMFKKKMVSKSYLHIRAFENTVLFSSMGSPNLNVRQSV